MTITPALIKKLVQIPLFQGLSQTEAHDFFEAATEAQKFEDEIIFREGDDGDSLIIVLEGEVEISKRGVELARLGAHSVLGEMSLVGADDLRSATAKALTDTRVLVIPSKRVQKMLRADALPALKVVANVARVLSLRLTAINDKFVETRLPKGKQREELADFGKILNRWSF